MKISAIYEKSSANEEAEIKCGPKMTVCAVAISVMFLRVPQRGQCSFRSKHILNLSISRVPSIECSNGLYQVRCGKVDVREPPYALRVLKESCGGF